MSQLSEENLKNIPTTYLLLVPSTYQSLLPIAFVLLLSSKTNKKYCSQPKLNNLEATTLLTAKGSRKYNRTFKNQFLPEIFFDDLIKSSCEL